MNLRFDIEQSKFQGTPEVIAAFRGYPARIRARLEDVLDDAVDEGRRIAVQEAPRGPILQRNVGMRIVDSIERGNTVARQGGAGGGATLERSLYANGLISPHLRYVFEGTGAKQGGRIKRRRSFGSGHAGIEARARARARGEDLDEIVPGLRELRASELTRNGRYFILQKEGEEVNFRAAVSGQAPQQGWWDAAREAMNARMEEGADRLFDLFSNQRPTQP